MLCVLKLLRALNSYQFLYIKYDIWMNGRFNGRMINEWINAFLLILFVGAGLRESRIARMQSLSF